MTEQDQTPPAAPDATDELAHAVDDISLRDLLVRAVVQSFYQPTPLGYQNVQQTMANGMGTQYVPVLQFGESPLQQTARLLFQQHQTAIMTKIAESLDVDALAEKIAGEVFAKLSKPDEYGYNRSDRLQPTAEAIRTGVRDRLVTEVAAETKARFEREQNEMYEAWRREQARDRLRLEAAAADSEGAERQADDAAREAGDDA